MLTNLGNIDLGDQLIINATFGPPEHISPQTGTNICYVAQETKH